MRRTLRKTAILRTTVLVAGKNGYGILIKGSPSAFPESGRSIDQKCVISKVRLRPEADTTVCDFSIYGVYQIGDV